MGRVKVRPVQLQQAQGIKGVIVQLGGKLCLAPAEYRLQLRSATQLLFHECRQLLRRGQIPLIAKSPGRPGQSHQHQAVPSGEHLVIQPQGHPLPAVLPQLLPEFPVALGQQVPAGVQQQVGDAFSLKIALFGDVVALAEMPPVILTQHGFYLPGSEEIVSSLAALAVRVLAAEKTAFFVLQLPETVVQGILRHLAVQGHVPVLPGLGIGQGQKRVIVQRLFKMGGQPLPVGGIAGKAAAEMVIDAALIHLPQGVFHLPSCTFVAAEGGVAQQEDQVVGGGKFGRGAEAAVFLIIGVCQLLCCPLQILLAGETALFHLLAAEKSGNVVAGTHKLLPSVLPAFRHSVQQGQKPGLPERIVFGQIGGSKKGLLLRRHDNGEGPAAAAGYGGADLHVYRVHIRPLLPVHLDRNKVPVQNFRHLPVLKGLVGHHMAPVTGGVADAEKNRLVLLLRPLKSFLTPGIPVHRILPVLAQIGGAFLR